MNGPLPNSLGHIRPTMPNTVLPKGGTNSQQSGDSSFVGHLEKSIQEINALQKNANDQITKLASGEVKDVHQVMVAAQEANLTFSMMMQVRNKIVEAYQEISKM